MPTIKGAKYNVKHTTRGKKVRLAWKNGQVVEAKNLKTGARQSLLPTVRKWPSGERKGSDERCCSHQGGLPQVSRLDR